jgi:hypothetical protein
MADNGRKNSGRKNADEVFLLSMACGATIESAAVKAGISPRTAHRRLLTPVFKCRLNEIKTEMVKRAAAMLTAASMESVKTLLALQESQIAPATRLGAARSVLELGTRLRESAELHERIQALEKQVTAEAARKNGGKSSGSYR